MGMNVRRWQTRLASLLAVLALAFWACGCAALGGNRSQGGDGQAAQTSAAAESGTSSGDAQASASAQDAQTEAQGEQAPGTQSSAAGSESQEPAVTEDGTYTSKDEVAWYLHTYGHLPSNYITKAEAEDEGWKSGSNSTLDKVCPGKSIGGDRFGNREGLLPSASGRKWYECDIDYVKGSRNAKRLVYSSDGLIYYTEDHYQSFEQLY